MNDRVGDRIGLYPTKNKPLAPSRRRSTCMISFPTGSGWAVLIFSIGGRGGESDSWAGLTWIITLGSKFFGEKCREERGTICREKMNG